MPCADCIQQAQQRNEAENTIFQKAQEAANRSGNWVGIYIDEFGGYQLVGNPSQFGFYPIQQYVTPKLQQP